MPARAGQNRSPIPTTAAPLPFLIPCLHKKNISTFLIFKSFQNHFEPNDSPLQEKRANGVKEADTDLLSFMLKAQQEGNAVMTDKQLRDELQVRPSRRGSIVDNH